MTPWTAACQAPLSSIISQSLIEFLSTESVMLSSHLVLCCPFSVCLQSFPAAGSFPMSQLSHQVAKVLDLQLQVSQWIFMVDFFRIDYFDLLVVQGTLKSLLQHHNLKASVFQYSAFLMAQLSHPYMTTGKTIDLTIWTLLAKWYLCFLICSRGLSKLSFQRASIFWFNGCNYSP